MGHFKHIELFFIAIRKKGMTIIVLLDQLNPSPDFLFVIKIFSLPAPRHCYTCKVRATSSQQLLRIQPGTLIEKSQVQQSKMFID